MIGNYRAGNFGDDAIFAGIISELREIEYHGSISYMGGNINSSEEIYGAFKKYPFLPLGFRSFINGNLFESIKAIKNSDLIIIGGGGLFVDTETIFATIIWSFHAFLCIVMKKPFICYSQSVGPLKSKISILLTKIVFNRANAIHLRDQLSMDSLRKLGVNREVTIGIDSAFSYLSTQIEQNKEDHLIISFRDWSKSTNDQWNLILDTANEFAYQKKLNVILVPMDISRKSEIEKMKKIHQRTIIPNSIEDLSKLVSTAKLVLSMRLHMGIFAASLGVPCLSIAVSQKLKFLPATIDINNLSKEKIIQNLHEIYSDQSKTKIEKFMINVNSLRMKNLDFLRRELEID